MAKKKRRRSKRRNQYRTTARQAAPRSAISRPRSKDNASRPQATSANRETVTQAQVDFHEEYRYVITDLKNMGLLAAAMFALVGILALILR